MAAVTSPQILSNNGSEPSTPQAPSINGVKNPNFTSGSFQRVDLPKNSRGLNKPKCITCGNVARSRCPYQSCKNCCSKAQNPCHIHVLKPNSTLADRGTTPSSTVPEQQPSETPATGPSLKATSFRQLSSAFAQFNNVHIPVRTRKPLTRKEVLTLNEWRFAKLKEYKEANIGAENESFDRYMHNISLLKEVFDVNSERPEKDFMVSNPSTTSDEKSKIISETKVILRSNPIRVDPFRKRVRESIDQGMRRLQKRNSNSSDDSSNLDNINDPAPQRSKSCWTGKTFDFTQLNFKLNQALNEEDLRVCTEMKVNITGQQKMSPLEDQTEQKDLGSALESDVSLIMVRETEVDVDTLNRMNTRFSTLQEIEDL